MAEISERKMTKNSTDKATEAAGEISIKENPKLEKLRKAPEEIVAKAIREMIRKDGGAGEEK